MIVDATFNESNSSFEPNVVEGGVTFSAKFSEGFGSNPDTGTGENGATFYPSVSAEGVLSWTNDKGLTNPDPVIIKGKDGRTPVKGTDYFTEADKSEMVQAVITALPKYNGEVEEL